jgi:hypothetical protein
MKFTAITCRQHARVVVCAAALAAGSGCACLSPVHASLIHSRVSGEEVIAGLKPSLQIGMPLNEATAYLESCGFQTECRSNQPSKFPIGEEKTAHYVRVFPHPTPWIVTHPEIHVLLYHDANIVTDIKSQMFQTTVD